MPAPLTIWTNAKLAEPAHRLLVEGVKPHRLVIDANSSASVLAGGAADPALADADIAFGQPHVESCIENTKLRWIELTSAGFTRYDREDFREALRRRGGIFTNASSVFAEPCAQHALAMMLACARQLLPAHRDQLGNRPWRHLELRSESRLLNGQIVLLLGYGAIGRRVAELLAPFRMKIYAVRRKTYSEPGVHIIPEEMLSSVIATADHVVNVLPENPSTLNYVNARRLGWCKRGARFYNVGRGTTVDQNALAESLGSGRLGAAYLDVTDPEPLPPSHPLWEAPNCFITPHSAGGRHDQDEALVQHFLGNLKNYLAGGETWTDRVL
ncbi:MAG: D-2-hydroxyacid dehydrogenase [Nibricoccus sp.]